MSISKMKKLLVIAPSDNADIIIRKLISLRCIDVVEFSDKECSDLLVKKNYDEESSLLEEKISKIEGVICALSKYIKRKLRLGDGRHKLDREAFVSSGEYFEASNIFEAAYSVFSKIESKSTGDDSAIREEFIKFAPHLNKLQALYDIEKTNLEIVKIKHKAAYSDSCTFILGWMPQKSREKVDAELSRYVCAYEITEPSEDDDPPVRIRNNPITRCFEWITLGAGNPKYSSFDPTFLMSFFCFLAFGLMIHDVGYGLILTLVGFFAPLVAGMSGKMKSVFNTLAICGISSMIFGVLFGGWFGNMPYAIMENLLGIENAKQAVPFFSGVWVEASKSPVFYLVLCLGLGAVQIILGMIIKFVLLCIRGKAGDAVLDILPWWVIFAGIAIAFTVNMIAGLVAICVGAIVVILFCGRDKKSVFARLGKGFIGISKIVIYAIDVISFLKIFVVGISLGILTYFVNLVGTVLGANTLGYILFISVSVIGHTICLCLSAFAALLFAKSLQQTQFFGRFYECGEEKFVCAEPSEKYTLDTWRKEEVEAV